MKLAPRRVLSAATLSLAVVATSLSLGIAPASAAYDPANPPYPADPNNLATLTIYNSTTGAVVTSGSTSVALSTLYFVASSDFAPGHTRAAVFGYLAETGKAPGAFSGQSLGTSTVYPATSAPAPVSAATTPTAKGGGSTFDDLATSYPNTAASTSDFYRLYQLRVFTTVPSPQSTSYASADIQIDPIAHTWTQVRPAPAAVVAPGAPTGVSAAAGDGQADVSWTAPASNGGAAITKYTVTATPTSGSPVTKDVLSGTSTTMTGLTNGTQYAVTVTATNSAGTGPASSPAVNVTPVSSAVAAGAPTGVIATPANASANVSWTAPASNGGAAITKYTVTATPTSGSPVTKDVLSGTSTTITGLTNGTQYAVTVTATNSAGSGPASSPAVNVTPATVPGAPTGVSATAGSGQADVSWTAPASDGGSAITKYTVIASPTSGSPVTKDVLSGTSTTITGLTNGTQYAITVTATNTAGTGPASSPAVNVTPTAAPSLPGAPTGVTATPGNGQATVSWTASSANGSAITKYTVTLTPTSGSPVTQDVLSGTSTTVAGLTNGTQYAVTVTATNGIGTGPASSPAVNVTPATVPGSPTGVMATAGNASASVSWTAPADNGGAGITKYTVTATPTSGAPVTKDVLSGTSTTITGLTNGTQYALTVTATNAAGTSAPSSPAVEVTPFVPTTAPGAPTGLAAASGNGQLSLTWTAPASNGNSPITSYVVTYTPQGGATTTVDTASTATSYVVTGLTNGTSYTIAVAAKNAVGTGVDSVGTTGTPGVVDTAVTLTVSRSVLTQGEAFTSSGVLAGGEVGSKTIQLRFLSVGHTTIVKTTTTTATGAYSFTYKPTFSTTVVAVFAGASGQKPSKSSPRGVAVRPKIVVTAPVKNPTYASRTVTVKGYVSASKAGTVIELLSGKTVLLRTRVGADGSWHFTRAYRPSSVALTVHLATTRDNAESFSAPVRFRVV